MFLAAGGLDGPLEEDEEREESREGLMSPLVASEVTATAGDSVRRRLTGSVGCGALLYEAEGS